MSSKIEIYDQFGHFKMPTPEQIATLDPDKQKNFEAVRVVALELEDFKASRKTPRAVDDALAERSEAEKELRRIRPKVTPEQNRKDWIASQRAE